MRFGVCYYPEQWPEERWAGDAAAMADLGLELVRIGEFAWSQLEPSRGQFAWEWLDRAVDTLSAAGLEVVLGTPTATPPVWLMQERPEIMAVAASGERRAYGSRRHTCPTSVIYRSESARITQALVDRYGTNEAVTAWQIDNEPGNHDSARCWCTECQAAFVPWLENRYGTIAALNEAWGTAFWSMTYPDFEAVRLPVDTVTSHNPSLLLAHRRFAARQVVDGLTEQAAIISTGSPSRPFTSNLYFGDRELDPRAVAGVGGLASCDAYPQGTSGPIESGFNLALHRSSAPAAWVMEHQSGRINWTDHNDHVPAGQVAEWIQAAAREGMHAFFFFRWRASRGGQEQYHTGLLDHHGDPNPAYEEIRSTIRDLQDAVPPSAPRAAFLWDIEDLWLIDAEVHAPGAAHSALTLAAYEALVVAGYAVDVVDPESDFSGYELAFAPALHIVTEARVTRLQEAAAAGTTVVIGARSLVRSEDAMWVADTFGGLELGVRVADFGTPPAGLTLSSGAPVGPWAERLEVSDAVPILTYASGEWDGAVAASRNGNLVYLGATSVEAWTFVVDVVTRRKPLHLVDRGDDQ